MMQKLMSYKKIIICAFAAVAVIAVAAIILLSNKEETFRSILVYDVEGNAVIERENVGTMNAVENLYLESGDRVSVDANSGMRMKLDDDKYVMAEADTIFSVEADGTDADSRTKICLEQGAITNEIQNPLREGSRFETSTPNSVMAVRGTIYRVEICVDENGDQDTKLCCFQGKVGTKAVLPDGAYGEELLVPAGSEVTVYQDGTVSDIKDIAYDELPEQAVQNLIKMLESGQSMTGITLEDLVQMSSETADVSEAPETEQAETASESETEKVADTQIHKETDTAKNVPAQPANEEQKTPSPQLPAPAPKPPTPASQPPKPANGGSVDNGNTGGDGSQDENPGSDDDGSDKDKPDKPSKPDKPKKPDKPDEPSDPTNYTVTFLYQGQVFATQTVKSGETVAAPSLIPAENGTWDFDFKTKIKADTTISWK